MRIFGIYRDHATNNYGGPMPICEGQTKINRRSSLENLLKISSPNGTFYFKM